MSTLKSFSTSIGATLYRMDMMAVKDLRLNKLPNIKPESVGRLRRPTDFGKSGLVFYFLASP